MKKIIAILLTVVTILSLTACGKKADVPIEEEYHNFEVPEIEEENEALQISISELDAQMADCFGDDLMATQYLDGVYYVLFTVDGISEAYGTETYYEFCETLDELSKTIYDTFDLMNIMILYNDNDSDAIFYATCDGDDITDILS